jgi:hypothetical protein
LALDDIYMGNNSERIHCWESELILLLLLSIAFDFSHVAPQDEKLIL